MSGKIPYTNTSGYADPTAHEAMTRVQQGQDEVEQRVHTLIRTLKNTIELSGFDLVARIEVRDQKTGRYFR